MSEHDADLLWILDEKSSEQPDLLMVKVQQLAMTSDNPDINQMLEELARVPSSFWKNADLFTGDMPSPSDGISSSS